MECGVKKFVFSSTCATYGPPDRVPMTEDLPQRPINPYGESKLMFEKMLHWYQQIYGLEFIAFRYFNAAGASEKFGEHHRIETHLIPNVLWCALGQKPQCEIFGTDYPTPDGTCIRDYIHIKDLAQAHILGLAAGQARLLQSGQWRRLFGAPGHPDVREGDRQKNSGDRKAASSRRPAQARRLRRKGDSRTGLETADFRSWKTSSPPPGRGTRNIRTATRIKEMLRPKSEGRNPKAEGRPKSEFRINRLRLVRFRSSAFGFRPLSVACRHASEPRTKVFANRPSLAHPTQPVLD